MSYLEETIKEQERMEQEQFLKSMEEDLDNALKYNSDMFKQSTIKHLVQENYLLQLGRESNLVAGNALYNDLASTQVADVDSSFFLGNFVTSTQINQQSQPEETEQFTQNINFEDLNEKLNNLKCEREHWLGSLNSHLPRTYSRILTVCAKIVGDDSSKMHNFVKRVEAMFLGSTEQKKRLAVTSKNLIKQYFEII
jgi:allantoicase